MRIRGRLLRAVLAAAASGSVAGAPAAAQQPARTAAPLGAIHCRDVTVNSGVERAVTIAALAAGTRGPSVLRPFSPRRRAALLMRAGTDSTTCATGVSLHRPSMSLWMNGRSAMHDLDGAVWQGRGLTAAATGGATFETRGFSAAVRPVAWITQNADYPIRALYPSSDGPNVWGPGIDLPYRLGSSTVARVAPGESWVRFDIASVGAGFSSAAQHWGPAYRFPLVMGTEAGGYPRVFLEALDLPLWIGALDAHWSFGRLESSGEAGLAPGLRSRASPALVVAFRPSFLDGLEVGGARFFHLRWSKQTGLWNSAILPLTGLLKNTNPASESEADANQVGSVFMRVAPGAGFEVYGELYREDHSWDMKDLVGEPDHASAFTLGVRRAWSTAGALRAVTVEGVNGRFSHLQRVRSQGPVYVHSGVNEGHTYLGQPLGSYAAFAGDGLHVGFEQVAAEVAHGAAIELLRSGHYAEGGSLNGVHAKTLLVRASRERHAASGAGRTAGISGHLGVSIGDVPQALEIGISATFRVR